MCASHRSAVAGVWFVSMSVVLLENTFLDMILDADTICFLDKVSWAR